MWLKGEGFRLEVRFTHVHDGRHHEHDVRVATVEAHALAHRLRS
jgi:hypothetical protein